MDHRVSKDMISSGMTPSGEKTQADLGKTQYGSAPSPNRLMDAYHSMYQDQKEETVDEGLMGAIKNVASKVSNSNIGNPRKPHIDNIKRAREKGFFKGMEGEATAELRKAGDSETLKADRRSKVQGVMQKAREQGLTDGVDLLAAYYAVYEHHQKDENGNTIPHEDDVKEGKLNPGLQAFLDKKKGKKKDDDGDEKKENKKDMKEGAGLYANIHAKRKRGGKMRKKGAKGAPSAKDFANAARTAKEELDLFDTVILEFVDQGYDEKEVIQAMSSLNEEQLQNLDEAIPAIAAALKPLAAIAKGSIGKTMTRAAIKMGGKSAGKIMKPIGKIVDNPMVQMQAMSSANQPKDKLNKSRIVSNQPATMTTGVDLFDIVKGQLLDEGLSEEEIRDIMLELTPEEIMSEMAVNPKIAAMDAKNKADMIARAKAKQVPQNVKDAAKRQYKAGTPRENPDKPYTIDDKKTIQNYYSKDN